MASVFNLVSIDPARSTEGFLGIHGPVTRLARSRNVTIIWVLFISLFLRRGPQLVLGWKKIHSCCWAVKWSAAVLRLGKGPQLFSSWKKVHSWSEAGKRSTAVLRLDKGPQLFSGWKQVHSCSLAGKRSTAWKKVHSCSPGGKRSTVVVRQKKNLHSSSRDR